MAWSFFKSKKEEVDQTKSVQEIALAQIVPNRYQPRKEFSEQSIQELAETIQKHGLLQPIVIREYEPEHYEIIAGERRFRAVSYLGWEKIPALVKEMTDSESASMSIIENLQREELTAIEEAQAYQRLMKLNQMTQVELAKVIGKSQSFVANKMRLLRLAPAVQRVMLKRELTERHGRCLVGLDEATQVAVMKKILAEHLSVKETEAVVSTYKKPRPKRTKKKRSIRGKTSDPRLAVNTIRKSVKMITDTGLDIHTVEEEHEGFRRIIIDIPVDKPAGK